MENQTLNTTKIMRNNIRHFLKNWIPPALITIFRDKNSVEYSGDYNSWTEAQERCTGYNSDVIVKRVKESLIKVKNGEAIYERDSVLFDRIQYSWPLLACLLWVANKQKGDLNIIDFGGSLGSTYYQNRKFLECQSKLQWNIVEQKHFVDTGKKYFENHALKFFYNIENCINQVSPNAILFSSVLQYLEKPYELLKTVKGLKFDFILIDRTSLLFNGKDRLTIQNVSPKIYDASYPCWFFNKSKFYSFFEEDYELISDFDALGGKIRLNNGQVAINKGMLFVRKRLT